MEAPPPLWAACSTSCLPSQKQCALILEWNFPYFNLCPLPPVTGYFQEHLHLLMQFCRLLCCTDWLAGSLASIRSPRSSLQSCPPASLSSARSGSAAPFQPISLPTLHHLCVRWLCRSHGSQHPLPSLHPLSWSCHHRLLSGWSSIISLPQICLISLVAVVKFEILLPDKPEKHGR